MTERTFIKRHPMTNVKIPEGYETLTERSLRTGVTRQSLHSRIQLRQIDFIKVGSFYFIHKDARIKYEAINNAEPR